MSLSKNSLSLPGQARDMVFKAKTLHEEFVQEHGNADQI